MANDHKHVIRQVWEKSKLDSLRLANGSAEARYKIIDDDYDKFLKPSQLDPLLKHELGRVVAGFKSAKPKLGDLVLNKVDTKVWKAEKEAHLAMGCLVSQSWLLVANWPSWITCSKKTVSQRVTIVLRRQLTWGHSPTWSRWLRMPAWRHLTLRLGR